MGFCFHCLDLARRWSRVSGHTGVSGPLDRNLRSPVFRCQMTCCGALLDSGPEVHQRWSRVSGPKDPDTPVLCFSLASGFLVVRYWTGVRRYTGDGPESPALWTGISGLKIFSALCIFVVRYWIGARSIPGEGPESPAWPESPALWTGISGLPR